MKTPLGRTVRNAGVVVVGLGAGTVLISTVTLTAVKGLNAIHASKHRVDCAPCEGKGILKCEICDAKGVLDWTPFPNPIVQRLCLCPACDGTKDQKCLNCLGSGVTTI